MNPVLQEGARSVQLAWISGIMTAVFLACFIGWVWWAYAARNRKRFEEAARLPLTTGDDE